MSLSKKFGQRRVQRSFAGLRRRLRTPRAKHHLKRREAENTLFAEWASAGDEDKNAFRLEAEWLGDWVAYEKMIACLTAIPVAQHKIEEQLLHDELIATECALPQCTVSCRPPRPHLRTEDRPNRIEMLAELRSWQRICEKEARRLWRRLIEHLKTWLQTADTQWNEYNRATFPLALVERLLYYAPTNLIAHYIAPSANVLEYFTDNGVRSCLGLSASISSSPEADAFAHITWLGDATGPETLVCWAALAWYHQQSSTGSVMAHLAATAFAGHKLPDDSLPFNSSPFSANGLMAEMLQKLSFESPKPPAIHNSRFADVDSFLSLNPRDFERDLSLSSRAIQALLVFSNPRTMCVVCNASDGLQRLLADQLTPCQDLVDELFIIGTAIILLGITYDGLGSGSIMCSRHREITQASQLINQEIASWVKLLFCRIDSAAEAHDESVLSFPLAESLSFRLQLQTCACVTAPKLPLPTLDWIVVVARSIVRADQRLNGRFVEYLRARGGVSQALRCEAAALFERGNFRAAYMRASGATELEVDSWQARRLMEESYARLMGRQGSSRRHRELIAEAVQLLLAQMG